MPIKAIAQMPEPQVNARMEALMQDVRDIIDKRVAVCEIIDPPYPQSTMRERLEKAVRNVIAERMSKAGAVGYIKAKEIFTVESRKTDGVVRWFVQFDAERWAAEWERVKGGTGNG
jgi:hypothetical protein